MLQAIRGLAAVFGLVGVLFLTGAVVSPSPADAAGPDTASSSSPPIEIAANEGDDLLKEDDELLTDSDDDLLEDSDDLLDEDDDLLKDEEDKTAEPAEEEKATPEDAAAQHAALFVESRYPSANTCATCHPKHYREWSVSQHAYAQLSPIYMAFQMAVNGLTSSTNGDFCIRCHNPVGMNIEESLFASNLDRAPTSREGITCVVCHRVNRNYGKVSGRLALAEGDLFTPIYGPKGGEELERFLSLPTEYRVVTERGEPGRAIHTEAEQFFQLSTPAFCATCHDVTLLNGFRLEEAFAEYKRSPAARNGVSCQDCHMGKIEGVDSGYEHGPAAVVGDVPTKDRKLTTHFFAGPDYPVIHPGIFPHNVRAAEFKTLREWLQFDYRAGWGTDEFEDSISDDHKFPESWESIDDRYDARDILNEQFDRLKWAEGKRLEVLRNGFHLGDIVVEEASPGGIDFSIDVINPTYAVDGLRSAPQLNPRPTLS